MLCNLLSTGRGFLRFGMVAVVALMLNGCTTPLSQKPWIWQGQQVPAQQPAPNNVPTASASQQKQSVSNLSKVALLLPLSGKGADTGRAMLNAAQLAMFDMNATNVFELIPEDTGRGAGVAMNDAVNRGANLILGPLFSQDAKTVTPIALQNNLNVMSFSTDTTAAVGNTFLMGFLPDIQVNRVLSHASSVGFKRIALIAPRNVYGDSVAQTFSLFMQRYALNNAGIVRYQGALPTDADLAVLSQGADAVLIAASAIDSHKISNMLSAGGMTPDSLKRLGTGLWDQPDTQSLTGLQGAWYAASAPSLRSRFEHRYFTTYGAKAPRLASLAYDATALAIVLARSGRGYSRASILSPSGFAGIDGIFRFNAQGMAERGLAVIEIRNGSLVTISDAPQHFGEK